MQIQIQMQIQTQIQIEIQKQIQIQIQRQDREHITQASVRHGNSSHQFYLSLDQRSLFGQWVADSSIQ